MIKKVLHIKRIILLLLITFITLVFAVEIERVTFNEDGSITYENRQLAAAEDSISYAVELTRLFIYKAIHHDRFYVYTHEQMGSNLF